MPIGSKAPNSDLPPTWRAMLATAVPLLAPPFTQEPTQPSEKAPRTRPRRSIVMSLKSSRFLQHPQEGPRPQTGPRCTGSSGVASVVVQVLPPS